jgi:cyclopropane-fatty-acyl-phospholipid synthase
LIFINARSAHLALVRGIFSSTEGPMDRLLRFALKSFIRRGNLKVITSRGRTLLFGDGRGDPVTVHLKTARAELRILLNPELHLGEAYMDGTLTVEQGSIADLLALVLFQDRNHMLPRWAQLQWMIRYLYRRWQQLNRPKTSRRNVAHHYDLDGRLYSLFLDADLQYSCAYFERQDQSLDDAQLAKKRHLAAKLLIEPGRKILDLGCGWGGLALYLAQFCRARVTGVTLSQEQLTRARERANERHLADLAKFRLQDYRDLNERFDRIVSVGMFEHVGLVFYEAFFRKCAELLADDGVMVLHSIGRSEGPNVTNPWMAKYIFPGGYIPSLSEVLPAIERAGLLVTDIEILRLHYAETLKAWRQRFLAHRDDVTRIYDERFLRMWEFYLSASEMAFREQAMMVFQIQLTRRQGIVPITRDYISREEQRLREVERSSYPPLRIAGE